MNTKQKIFLLSNEPWGDLWFSKHHYAYELSKLGNKVYFINAPKKWSFSHFFNRNIQISNYSKNLFIVNYNNPIPIRLFLKLAIYINDFFVSKALKKKLNIQSNDLQWTFDPLRFVYFPLCSRIIYHVADPYMSLYPTKYTHHVLAQKSLKIVCTSPHYVDFYQKQGYVKTLYMPHMVSSEEFDIDQKIVDTLKQKYGHYILLVGTINSDVDIELLKSIADLNLDAKLLIAGSVHIDKQIFETLSNQKNILYLGVINAKLLKNYINASQVCITGYYFTLNKGVGSGSPLKMLHYLSQYKPIVTSINSEIPELENIAIYRAHDKNTFLELIKKALNNTLFVNQDAVSSYLQKHQYPIAIQKILENV
jgi:hypothetical protein